MAAGAIFCYLAVAIPVFSFKGELIIDPAGKPTALFAIIAFAVMDTLMNCVRISIENSWKTHRTLVIPINILKNHRF
jgi:hypothetical protein